MAHLRGRAGVGAGVVAAVLLLVSWLAPPPASASTPWGACGLGTDEDKLVTQYAVNARTNVYLRCGGPRWDPNPTSGYRHILAKHRGDFERLAFGTYQNWRDIADLAMEAMARDPDVAIPVRGAKACYSRAIFVRNLRTNQVVGQRIVKMIVVIATNNIVTAYPASRQCEVGDETD
jgi:hypothetical protein